MLHYLFEKHYICGVLMRLKSWLLGYFWDCRQFYRHKCGE
jgi:hypothetical protein|nr:MAG TPA: hypothetical protein [Crassvirales sp.]